MFRETCAPRAMVELADTSSPTSSCRAVDSPRERARSSRRRGGRIMLVAPTAISGDGLVVNAMRVLEVFELAIQGRPVARMLPHRRAGREPGSAAGQRPLATIRAELSPRLSFGACVAYCVCAAS